AMDETSRRREKQQIYNKVHGIQPTTIKKAVHNVMEGAYAENATRGKLYPKTKAAEAFAEYQALSPAVLSAKIDKLEKKMFDHAHNLEFEEAAATRDLIRQIRENLIVR